LVPSPRRACSNVPGIEIILEDPNTIISIMTLAMSHDINPPRALIPRSCNSIFFGPNDIVYN